MPKTPALTGAAGDDGIVAAARETPVQATALATYVTCPCCGRDELHHWNPNGLRYWTGRELDAIDADDRWSGHHWSYRWLIPHPATLLGRWLR